MAKEVELARRFWDSRGALATVVTLTYITTVDSGVFAIEGPFIYHCWWMLSLLVLVPAGFIALLKMKKRQKELRSY